MSEILSGEKQVFLEGLFQALERDDREAQYPADLSQGLSLWTPELQGSPHFGLLALKPQSLPVFGLPKARSLQHSPPPSSNHPPLANSTHHLRLAGVRQAVPLLASSQATGHQL